MSRRRMGAAAVMGVAGRGAVRRGEADRGRRRDRAHTMMVWPSTALMRGQDQGARQLVVRGDKVRRETTRLLRLEKGNGRQSRADEVDIDRPCTAGLDGNAPLILICKYNAPARAFRLSPPTHLVCQPRSR